MRSSVHVGQWMGQGLHEPLKSTRARYWFGLHAEQFVGYNMHYTQVASHFLANASFHLVL